ncbi:MAG TPA: molybdate ABC transporter substrate-binding protein [Pyrinomonadaceae bacterium]|nr:molybdate ABC transporter substrate-binding protein [Pyrinomonadaceae bacterium]
MKKALPFILLVSFVTAGCAPRVGERPVREEIVVAAAANLTEAFEEVGRRFTAKTGVRVVNSFGATADLSKQIEHGAPFDVFAAADVKHVEALERKGLLADGSRAVYARGRLVLWFPRGGAGVEDLTGAGVTKVAVAKPELAPYGEAAVEALRALGVWERVEPKVVYAQNVAQAKQFAATGNAEAAFVPRSLLKANEGAAVEIDGALHKPIEQSLGIVRSSKKQEAARRFTEFVLSEEGQALLESYGYERGR